MIPGQLGPIRAFRLLVERVFNRDHVLLRDTLGDANNQRDLCFDGFKDPGGCEGRGNVDDRRIAVGSLLGFCNCVEHRETQVSGATFLGSNAANHLGAVSNGLLAVERALLSGKSLADYFGVLVHKDLGCR